MIYYTLRCKVTCGSYLYDERKREKKNDNFLTSNKIEKKKLKKQIDE